MSDEGVSLAAPRRDGDGWSAEVRVHPDSAWFAGHFPGEPVLPAVGQITLFDRLYRAAGGAGGLLALDSLRLTAQVLPGDRLLAHLSDPDDAGRRRVRLTPRSEGAAGDDGGGERPRGGRPVSSGTLAWSGDGAEAEREPAPAGPRDAGNGASPARPTAELPDPVAVLPHRPPARLAEAVLAAWDGGLRCRGRVPADSPAVADGVAGAWMALELAAQAAGLLQAAGATQGAFHEPRVGYVVRLRDVRFQRPTLPADTPMEARVELQGAGGPLSLYRARVDLDGAAVITATLGTFVPPIPG